MATAASKKLGLNKHFCQVLIAFSPGLQKPSPSIWRIQPSLSTHCLPLELFLWAFDDHGYSIPASPLPHSYASLPCLLSHTHFLAMGQLHREFKEKLHPGKRRGFPSWQKPQSWPQSLPQNVNWDFSLPPTKTFCHSCCASVVLKQHFNLCALLPC